MSPENTRAKLDFGDDDNSLSEIHSPIDKETIKLASRSVGFRETPLPSSSTGITKKRRSRKKTGRTEQFATRLKLETVKAIHHYADENDLTLAETIEVAISKISKRK